MFFQDDEVIAEIELVHGYKDTMPSAISHSTNIRTEFQIINKSSNFIAG